MTPQWKSRYSCHSLELGGIEIYVNWESNKGFKVGVSTHGTPRQLKQRFQDLSEAKKAGIELAQQVLSETQEALQAVIDLSK